MGDYLTVMLVILAVVTVFVMLLTAGAAGLWALWLYLDGKFSKVFELVGGMVTHDTCAKRRESCPCVKELEELRKSHGS